MLSGLSEAYFQLACLFFDFGPTTAVARAHMIALVIDWQLIVGKQILNCFEGFLPFLHEGSTRLRYENYTVIFMKKSGSFKNGKSAPNVVGICI